ncbi:hypothetical protein F4861DRAFT_381035 [Xylaria intraflava]|nr:hypothetical protein F4861DRAFT_381035 [Xylaria intraflava]
MFTPRSPYSNPLRLTCDRCRELKVRCAKDDHFSIGTPGSACTRCAKANAVCLFSPKQPSGRPITARPGSGSTEEKDKQPPVPWPGTGLLTQDIWDNDNFLPNVMEMELATPNYETMLSDAIHSPGEYAARASVSSSSEQALDPTETGVHQISNMNLRIYRAAARATSFPTQQQHATEPTFQAMPTSDELIGLASGVMELGDQVAKPQHPSGMIAFPHGAFASDPLPAWFPVGGIIDTSMTLMVLSCHDRLLGLFCLVCSALHIQETRRMESTSKGQRNTMASAQAIMVVELVKHLLERLERNQMRLIEALNPSQKSPQKSPRAGQGTADSQAESEREQASLARDGVDVPDATIRLLQDKQSWILRCITSIKSIVSKQALA